MMSGVWQLFSLFCIFLNVYATIVTSSKREISVKDARFMFETFSPVQNDLSSASARLLSIGFSANQGYVQYNIYNSADCTASLAYLNVGVSPTCLSGR